MTRRKRPVLTNQLRDLRFNCGELTQEEVAKTVGVTRQTIIAIEAGDYTPSLALAFRIAQAFGLKIEDVFQYGPKQGRGK